MAAKIRRVSNTSYLATSRDVNRAIDQINREFTTVSENSGGGGLGSFDVVSDGPLAPNGSFDLDFGIIATIDGNKSGTQNYSLNTSAWLQFGLYDATATYLTLPSLVKCDGLAFNDSRYITTISCPELVNSGSQLRFSSNQALTTYNFPKITQASLYFVGNVENISNPTMNFPLLTNMYISFSNWYYGWVNISGSKFPALRTIAFDLEYCGIVSLDFPLVTELGYTYLYQAQQLTTLNFPGLTKFPAYLDFSYKYPLANVTFGVPGTVKSAGEVGYTVNANFRNCGLTQASVDNMLAVYASLDGTNGTNISNNGTLYLHGGANSAPSAAGLASKDILLARGWTITHN